MKALRLALLAALVAAAAITTVALMRRAPTLQEKLTALEDEVRPRGGIVFRAVLQGQPRAFLLLDCKLYLLEATTSEALARTPVLRPGFYPWFTACTGQSIRLDAGHLRVELGNRALGAGGGNTSGGAYRSLDGLAWEKHTPRGWRAVDQAQD